MLDKLKVSVRYGSMGFELNGDEIKQLTALQFIVSYLFIVLEEKDMSCAQHVSTGSRACARGMNTARAKHCPRSLKYGTLT